jgi:hypothetical protein
MPLSQEQVLEIYCENQSQLLSIGIPEINPVAYILGG